MGLPQPPGHEGSTRPKPQQVDEERERYVWDLVPPRVHVVCYRIARYPCPRCRRLVEKKPQDVLPGHHLSLRAMTAVV